MSDQKNPKTLAFIKFRTIAHFFDPDDPSPENDRELTDRAERVIFLTVLDVPDKKTASICDHIELAFPSGELSPDRSKAIIAATKSHFRLRAQEFKRDTNLTVRIGTRECGLTLLIGVPAITGIFIAAHFHEDPVAILMSNILVIFVWVVIWQPFQSLVFDRWTQKSTAKVYQEIAEMDMKVIPV
jgi:hypothetical protein